MLGNQIESRMSGKTIDAQSPLQVALGTITPAAARTLAAASLVVLLSGVGSANAQDNQWMRFASGGGGFDAVSSRDFGRRWEANPPRGYPTLSKDNIAPMKAAIKRYRAIVKKGGWPKIPKVKLRPNYFHPAVKLLRKRLIMSGDLSSSAGISQSYDYSVEKAVRRYQASNGLTPTGVMDRRTRAALNVSARARLKQLKVNLRRLIGLSRSASKKRYIMVNIPAAQIEAVEGNRVISRHSGVVGKSSRPTPLLRSTIRELNFNKVWHLPPTVVNKDLIPKGRRMAKRGKDVLAKYHIDAYSNGRKIDPSKIRWNTSQPYRLSYSQQPGKDNPLGFLKINFDNPYSVYLHDTPKQRIFGRNFRAASSGCVRVQNISKLAAWILKYNDGWSRSRINSFRKSGKTKNVRVKKPVPLYFVYLTAWVTKDGVVQFRRDLYHRDGVGRTASAY